MEDILRENISSRNNLLSEIVTDIVEAGGKRLRPALVIISSRFGKYKRDKILPAACAIEILHTATLIHDDIVDCSALRRGKTTVAKKYGSNMAIYTGDFLLTKAVLLLSRNLPPDKVDIAARAMKSICEGEVDQYQDRFLLNVTVPRYLKRIGRKTAMLFASACSMGAILAGCSYDVSRNLGKFGFYYGMTFQIRDDLLDFISDTASQGKPVGKDLKEGSITLPVIYALRHSLKVREALEEFIQKGNRSSDQEVDRIVELVKTSGGIDYSWDMLSKYVDRGLAVLEKLPANQYRSILMDIIQNLKVPPSTVTYDKQTALL